MAPSSTRRARRAFSQNFLTDPAAVRKVIDAAALRPRDLVYEVGAGRGQLTRHLVRMCREVIAFEVDPSLVNPYGTVRHEDFLRAAPAPVPFAVVGNIPYSLTSAVVDWCLRAPALTGATLLTQLEYARKRTGDYGRWSRLTVRTWPSYEWRLAGRIPRTAFRPVPRVDSGILRVIHRDLPLVQPAALPAYRRFVDLGFTGAGGSLAATLGRRYGAGRTSAAFRSTRVPPDVPVGLVWPEQWLALFRLICR
ncbi:MAG TPA: ErmE/ErmH/ErmO/ErmR family 23S rRNA (adenine(2058)-N(6))-methyltransferase [Actinoplanes sp.]|nr:ErmE/ErmH/ErmO/ErmR family 23S rRNA (adenine(2058)-N(6))-methyltransferase [Actinoplanes sp.]